MQEFDFNFMVGLVGLLCGCLLAVGLLYAFLE